MSMKVAGRRATEILARRPRCARAAAVYGPHDRGLVIRHPSTLPPLRPATDSGRQRGCVRTSGLRLDPNVWKCWGLDEARSQGLLSGSQLRSVRGAKRTANSRR